MPLLWIYLLPMAFYKINAGTTSSSSSSWQKPLGIIIATKTSCDNNIFIIVIITAKTFYNNDIIIIAAKTSCDNFFIITKITKTTCDSITSRKSTSTINFFNFCSCFAIGSRNQIYHVNTRVKIINKEQMSKKNHINEVDIFLKMIRGFWYN